MVSTTIELSEKFYTGAHLQSRGYKVLVEIYLKAASLINGRIFPRDFLKISEIFANSLKNCGAT